MPKKGMYSENLLQIEVQVRFKAKAGKRYVVIPATMYPLTEEKPFWLRVYFSIDLY